MVSYPISSANIVAIGYDEVTETLEIQFKLNIKYHYFNVPLSEYIELMKAPNPEEYYLNFIKYNYHFELF